MNVVGHSVFAFKGVEPHIPLNPRPPQDQSEWEGLPTVDDQGREYCRITLVAYMSEVSFSRRDADQQPYPLATDVGTVIGMKGHQARTYKTFLNNSSNFFGSPVRSRIPDVLKLAEAAGRRVEVEADINDSLIKAAIFIEKERALKLYRSDCTAQSSAAEVHLPSAPTRSTVSIKGLMIARGLQYLDALGKWVPLPLNSIRYWLDTPDGDKLLARIERQLQLSNRFIHPLPTKLTLKVKSVLPVIVGKNGAVQPHLESASDHFSALLALPSKSSTSVSPDPSFSALSLANSLLSSTEYTIKSFGVGALPNR